MEPPIKNKSKSIIVNLKDEKYSIDLVNEGSKLAIEAKTSSGILSLIYTNKFSLEDIKKTRLFIEYESIDECLDEIFKNLDKNETQIEKKNDSTINVKVPLYIKRFPFIEFPLMKKEKNENEKYSELLNIVSNLKRSHDNEIQLLKNKINFLENLLKAKNNKDYKKGLESFKGSIIEMTCFGRNEIDNYFDLKQDYALINKDKEFNFLSFVFKCKNDDDIPSVIEDFHKIKKEYDGTGNLFTRVKNNKLYVEVRFHATDLFEIENLFLDNLCFCSGESLIIKTEAIPRDIFEEYKEEKILKFLLGIEVEFSNLSPQLQNFGKTFQNLSEKLRFPDYLRAIIKDIYVNLLNGNYKYKIEKYLLEGYVKQIHEHLIEYISGFALSILRIQKFKKYKKINFNEIEINLITPKYRAGFNFIIKVPKYNELIEDIITNERNQYEY